ncbi:MAG: Mov34/MPN/PAD-1 family protein, partial [bacterium]
MPLLNDYHMNLELYDQDGRVRHQFEVDSFRNCLEDFKFSSFRKRLVRNNGLDPVVTLEPLWEEEGKSPYCHGFRLCFRNKKALYKKAYSTKVFKYHIYRAVRELIENNQLEEGMELKFRMSAFLNKRTTAEAAQPQSGKISVTSTRQPMPIIEQNLKHFSAAKRVNHRSDMPVWIAQHVVKEMIDHTLANKESERAGFLLGHLCQDPETRALFLVCRAQVVAQVELPNEYTSSLTHFQFSPEIFCEVQRVISLRKKNEVVLGWWHSHPWPFACRLANQCECTSIFFSAADFSVMETAFGAPYQVAIVVGRASLKNMEATA